MAGNDIGYARQAGDKPPRYDIILKFLYIELNALRADFILQILQNFPPGRGAGVGFPIFTFPAYY